MVVGLTGLFCSGKSTVEKILAEKFNFIIIDVDKIGHTALVEKKKEIIKNFEDCVLSGSDIDRKKLGKIVFNDKKKLALLNSIVHPFMIEKVKNTILNSKSKNILINAALLFEMGLNNLCSMILVVKAPLFEIIKRAKKRSGYSAFQTIKILFRQKVLKLAKKSRNKADIFYITNSKNINYLEKVVNSLFKERI